MGLVTYDWKIDLLIGIFTLLIFLYYKIKSIYSYFEKRNIKYIKPKFLLGSDPDVVLFKCHISESWEKIYQKLENEKYGGFFQAIQPTLMIKDPEYINDILKTSFEHFTDRGFLVDEKTNPLDEHLFFIGGNKWKFLRNKMTPLFSPVKLKWMYGHIEECVNLFDECMAEMADGKDVDIKELLARCATDIIMSCAFGVEPQSLKNPNSEFRTVGRDFFDPKKKTMKMTVLRFFIPRLLIWFKVETVSKSISDFFLSSIKTVMNHRRTTGIVRKDFVQLLLELKDKKTVEIDSKEIIGEDANQSPIKKIELTDNLLAAQSFVFFLAGFETTSSSLYFTYYLLAKHPEIQERARKEVLAVKAKYGQISFDCLKELKFLNMCIAETSRIYPSVPFLNRKCTKEYTLPDGTVIEKDTTIAIPTLSIQRDHKYFPEPFKYNPDRFENTPSNGTYLPFGDGPRICIGKRFAETVMGSMLARSLEKYKFDLSPMNKSDVLIKLNPRVITSSPVGGLLIRINKINSSN